MAVTKRLRYEILRRDNHACRYCGARAPEAELVVDHVVARALGGGDEPSNLVASCKACNSGKSSVPADATIVEDVTADALRWAQAIRGAADALAADDHLVELMIDQVGVLWDNWTYESGGERRTVPKAHDWRNTVEKWVMGGVTHLDTYSRLIRRTMSAPNTRQEDRWKFFCGSVWGRMREQQSMAVASLIRHGVETSKEA